jgi:mitochondrial distribution and morphology protein 10
VNSSHTVSTGIRFTTLPDATPPSFQVPPLSSSPLAMASKGPPSQPPTTVTALFNPMMGHMSGAYSARVSRNLSLSTRFDFNVYSYHSEWTMGAEWWLRRNPTKAAPDTPMDDDSSVVVNTKPPEQSYDVHGVVKARASTNNVCFHPVEAFCISLLIRHN